MVIEVLLFMLPTIVAANLNYVVLYFKLFPSLNKPISERLFGSNKTWRGVVSFVFWGIVGGLFAYLVDHYFFNIGVYTLSNFAWLGALQGLGWVVGELPNSYFKRRLGIQSGKSADKGPKKSFFTIINQIDSPIVCGLVAYLCFNIMTVAQLFLCIISGSVLHFYGNLMLYKLGIRKAPPH